MRGRPRNATRRAETVTDAAVPKRKLIEVSLPLEAINREAVRDGGKRKDYPWRMHYWWARRKLAVGRAVLFAQLVDDPSSHPELFPTEESQVAERERLHAILRDLVKWENIHDTELYARARAEILKSTGGNPPVIVDPFAGGGTIPLEAQRLGLEVRAADLNPVAVLINKALIEIPPRFAGKPPVFPGAARSQIGPWARASGLAEDVRRYGDWVQQRAMERIGHLYPSAELSDGSEAKVMGWLWARTVTCPNPACGIEMPLVRSWWLSNRKGRPAFALPSVVADARARGGRRVVFTIGHKPNESPLDADIGTMSGRAGGKCVACGTAASTIYIKSEGIAGNLGETLIAVIAEGARQRVYLAPTEAQRAGADCDEPPEIPEGTIAENPRWFSPPAYGLTSFADLFTKRQLTALATLSDLVREARERVLSDAQASGLETGTSFHSNGGGARAYADAVTTLLALTVSSMTDSNSSLTAWHNKNEQIRGVFSRQAIPMIWDYFEVNPLAEGAGGWRANLESTADSMNSVPAEGSATVRQVAAQAEPLPEGLISTDPPYYDNVGYSDLSDFFYVWLRPMLREVHPDLFSTLLVPKADELVANPYRHGGRDLAAKFFEAGFENFFTNAADSPGHDAPITVYYAFKQSEKVDAGVASTGWATILSGLVRAGWQIVATWPFRTETTTRLISQGTNSLASSVVLALRRRDPTAPAVGRGSFIAELKTELPRALIEMQQGSIAPVDLTQAAIGPGMAIFSRHSRVVDSDGGSMSVKTALALINQVLDEVRSELDANLDADSRFCIKWYEQFGWDEKPFGEADVLARAMNTSVDGLARGGILTNKGGKVKLLAPKEVDPKWDPATDARTSVWEAVVQLCRVLTKDGMEDAASLMSRVKGRTDLDEVRGLAYRLSEIAQKGRTQDAIMFSNLATSWIDLKHGAERTSETKATPVQGGFDLESLDDE